jgi:head-tail adaptor
VETGQLRERIVVKKKTTVADSQGGRAVTWVDAFSGNAAAFRALWASVDVVNTSEGLASSTAISAQQQYRVVVRHRPELAPTMRVYWTPYRGGSEKTLEIRGVRLLDREFTQLDCSEAA